MSEIVFTVEQALEGGFVARAVGPSIYAQADSMADLRAQVRDAVRCHFDRSGIPETIWLQSDAEGRVSL